MRREPRHTRREADADSDIAPACRLSEHALCDGNLDLPGVPGGIPLPLTRCACSCHRGGHA